MYYSDRSPAHEPLAPPGAAAGTARRRNTRLALEDEEEWRLALDGWSRLGSSLRLNLEGERRETVTQGVEHSMLLRGKSRFRALLRDRTEPEGWMTGGGRVAASDLAPA